MSININQEQVFLVGGAVRDVLLGIDPKDKDYVVVGMTEEQMLQLGFEQVGKDFPVFLHPHTKEEYALARKERKTSSGYNGFAVETKDVTLEEDLFRRDLTINAMAISRNGEIIDPYDGKSDLANGILRHVSNHFCEDPVRILRIARFSARYNFDIADTTKDLMSAMIENGEFDSLTAERVWKEFEKALSEKHLHRFFDALESINALEKVFGVSQFPEKDYFNFIRSKTEDVFLSSLLHTFSQIDKNELEKWRLPSDEKTKIQNFTTWKDNSNFYKQLSTEEKLRFIQETRALNDNQRGICIIEQVNLYQSWKFNQEKNKQHSEIFLRDLDSLKSLDYPSIIEESKKLKVKPSELVKHYQKECLQEKLIRYKPH